MTGGMEVVSPPCLSNEGGTLRSRSSGEVKCTVESACRKMRLGGSTTEGNECVVVEVPRGEWPLGEGQLFEAEQPRGIVLPEGE